MVKATPDAASSPPVEASFPAQPGLPQPGSSPSLENLRITQQAQLLLGIRRKANQDAARFLHTGSSLQRVRDCWHHSVLTNGAVGVRVRPTDLGTRANFTNLVTCGSGTSCPTCADKIMPRRAREILALVDAHHTAHGQVMSGTYTLAHIRGDTLASLWRILNAAWGAASGGRKTTKKAMASHVVGWIRNVETTWSYRHGWHLHIHALWLLTEDTTTDDAERIAASSFNDWRDKAIDMGASAPDPRAFKSKILTLGESVEAVAGYLAKGTYETAAWELAGGPRKLPATGHYTPFILLERLVERILDREGEIDDVNAQWLALWHEWEQASRGKRMISYSQGVRAHYQLSAELTDQELADDDQDQGVVLEQTISAETWAAIRYSAAWRLLRHLEAGTIEDAEQRLRGWLREFEAGMATRPAEFSPG